METEVTASVIIVCLGSTTLPATRKKGGKKKEGMWHTDGEVQHVAGGSAIKTVLSFVCQQQHFAIVVPALNLLRPRWQA